MRWIVALAVVLSGCTSLEPATLKPVNPYPAEFRVNFIKSCNDGSSPAVQAYCGCMIEALQREYTYWEFTQTVAPRLADGTSANDERFTTVAKSCKR